MHTPSAALAWELWRRHRSRIIVVVGLLLGFVLVYPRLCAHAGFNWANQDALGEIVKQFTETRTQPSPLLIFCVLYGLFLACGPTLAMMLTLLCVIWMFTFIELDLKTRSMTFPARLFTLPVSTNYLFGWLLLAGMAAIALLYGCWVYFVPMPNLEMFGAYQTCFGWLTLLVLGQAIVWSLDARPVTRVLVLAAVFFCFIFAPVKHDLPMHEIIESPAALPLLFVLGVITARVGLQKMRHGQWQGLIWQWPFAAKFARAELKGPKRFASPAQAQLWFEWRRFARRLCFYTVGLTLVPAALCLLARCFVGLRPLETNTLAPLFILFVFVPVFLHFAFATSPPRTDLPFLMLRPLTNGQMMIATLKAAALSTLISWALAFAAICALPLLGNFHALLQDTCRNLCLTFPNSPGLVIIAALLLLTWRMIPVNLGFVLSGHRQLARLPVWILLALYLAGGTLTIMSQDTAFWNLFCRLIPGLLAGLVALKLLLAFLAFRLALERRLLAPSALRSYLAVWILLAAVLLSILYLSRPAGDLLLPLSLGVVLLLPLARIGFCPVAISWNRHT